MVDVVSELMLNSFIYNRADRVTIKMPLLKIYVRLGINI